MADNLELNAGSGGATLATDDISDVHYQLSKLGYGALNTFTIITASAGLPIQLQSGHADIKITLDGEAVALSATDNAVLDAIAASVAIVDDWDESDRAKVNPIVGQAGVAAGAGAVDVTVPRVTLASDDPAVVDLAAIEALAITIDADTDAIKTAVELIDDAIYTDDDNWTDDTSKHMLVGGLYQSTHQTITDGDVAPIQLTSRGHVITTPIDSSMNDLEFAKENDNWNAADHGIILFARDVDSTPDKYRAVQTDADGHLKVDLPDALPAGSNAIGKLAANTGVDIGDVDVTSVVPGVGATNLGKAIGGAAGATDTGVPPLVLRDDALSALSDPEGDYVPLRANSTGALHVTGAGGGTQYQVDDSAGATDTGTLSLAIRDDSLTTLTPVDGDYVGLRVSSTGALHVTGGGGGTEYTEDVATANPIVGTATLMERDDVIASLTPVEGDWAAFRCSAEGALWTQDFNSDAILADTAAMVVDLAALEALAITIDSDTNDIKTAVELLDNAVDGNYLNVNVNAAGTDLAMNAGVLSAQTQRVTIATDDEVNNLLGTIDTDTGVIAGDTTSIDGKITACDTGAVVLTTGSAAIGKLAANTGVDIGDVDVTSVIPGVGATNLGKARASALGATDTGVAALAVRNDDLADLSGADGDYTPLQVNPEGALYVSQAKAEGKQASGVGAGGAPGTDDMIAAVEGKKLLILALSLFATSTTTNTVYVDNVDNDLLGNSGNGIPLSLDADGDTVPGFILPYNPDGWFKTDAVNEAVTLNSSAAQDIIWCITYIETD